MNRILEKINNVIEPNKENNFSRAYDCIMLMAIVIGILPLLFRTQYKLFWYFDIISCLCFVIDYILRWITCGLRSKKKNLTTYIIYPFTPMAIIDLVSILPTINLLPPTFKVARISRLLKILRVVKVIRYYESLEIILAVIRKQRKILYTVLSLAMFYIFITARIISNDS